MSNYNFPKNFTWGAATASYQIEGAVNDDGRGKSIWDAFCDEPGRVVNGDSGNPACDHYNRWKSDIGLMKQINLSAYRFSLAWPRIFPNGDGPPNNKGIDFYNHLIDGLLEAGIEPWITLFHWDLPLSLQQRFGGWHSRETAKYFADYAAFCVDKFGDRVKHWFTMNEIFCFTKLAYHLDHHAPGGNLDLKIVNQITHNALLGHGMAVRAIRDIRGDLQVGLVENLNGVWPLWETTENIEAAKQAFRDLNMQRLFPALTGKYDKSSYEKNNGILPEISDGDMEIIGTPTDFIGYNFYTATPIVSSDSGWKRVSVPEDYPRTDMGWPITPEGLYWTIKFSSEYFPSLPIYITENGSAEQDKEEQNGSILDVGRIEYYRTHLTACSRASSEGAPLAGYFAWSLMDNFEWAFGYTKRFGLIRVNFRTQERTIKASGKYYAAVVKAGQVL